MVIAHRGGSGLAPENTLRAFERSIQLGVDAVELDVQVSRDGHLIVSHDPTVDRTTDGSGAIPDMLRADLRRLDAGHRFTSDEGRSYPFRGQGIQLPDLGEVLAAAPDLRLSIELKAEGVEPARTLLAAILEAGAQQRVCVGSFHDRPVRWLREACPGLATHATASEVRRLLAMRRVGLGWLAASAASVLTVPEVAGGRRIVTPRLVRFLTRRGIPVHVWCVNAAEDMHRLVSFGVSGIITSRPDRALETLR